MKNYKGLESLSLSLSLYTSVYCFVTNLKYWKYCLYFDFAFSRINAIRYLSPSEFKRTMILYKRCGNRIKAGFFNVIIQDIAVYGDGLVYFNI